MIRKTLNKLKKFLKKFFLIDDSPAKVASGAALGIFLGIIPGEGILSTLFFAYIFRLNRLAALAGVFATNMWTTMIISPLAATVGGFVFHQNAHSLMANFYRNYQLGIKSFLSVFVFFNLILPLMVGFIIVAGIIAIIFYLILYFLLKYKKIKFK